MGMKGFRSTWGPATVRQAWPELSLPHKIGNLQPDGIVRSDEKKKAYIVEVARTMEYGRCIGRQPPWERSWRSGREENVGKRAR